MGVRLVILVVIAAGLAVFFAVRKPANPVEIEQAILTSPENPDMTPGEREELIRSRATQTPLGQRPLPGEEPAIPPELEIRVEANPESGKNRLIFYINEAHGYYVEEFDIRFWWKPDGQDIAMEDSPLVVVHRIINKYLKANETFQDCLEVVDAELIRVGGSIGKTENWAAAILRHGRAREKNPDPLPLLPNVPPCIGR